MFTSNHYIYQFKNCKNYFFRIRLSFSKKFNHNIPSHFCASLRTSDEMVARWLASFIKPRLDREIQMLSMEHSPVDMGTVDTSDLVTFNEISGMSDFSETAYKIKLKNYLKERFNKLLISGQKLIDCGLYDDFDIPQQLTPLEKRELDLHANQLINSRSNNVAALIDSIPVELRQSPSGDKTSSLIETSSMIDQLLTELKLMREQSNYAYIRKEQSLPSPFDIISFSSNTTQLSNMKKFLTPLAQAKEVEIEREYKISNLYKQFKEEISKSINLKTVDHYDISFNFLQEKFGDLDVRNLNKKLAVGIKQAVMSRAGRKRAKEEKLSAKRTNAFLSNYRVFMTWYLSHSDEERPNPFSGLDVQENRKTDRFKRRIFVPTELEQIIHYYIKHRGEAKAFREAAHWFPVLGYYSGMRLNEIANLSPKRVRKHNGIWIFDLVGLDLKNEASERFVPIHDVLLDMGIVEFAKKQSGKNHSRLFPELKKGKNGFGDAISKWFNRTLLRNVGVDKEEEGKNGVGIDFHSLRKTFIDTLNNEGAQLHHIKLIVGHSNHDDVTLRHYTMTPVSLGVLRDLVNQIPRI
jgi:integrase